MVGIYVIDLCLKIVVAVVCWLTVLWFVVEIRDLGASADQVNETETSFTKQGSKEPAGR